MYIPRQMEGAVLNASRFFPVVMVTGPRQSGKTTLLRNLSDPKRRFVTLDDLDLRRLAREDPKLFINQFPPPVLIDEFQYAPELLSYIKIEIDKLTTTGRNEEAAGMYWLTGSQNFLLMKNIRESLTGRVAIFNLLGFSPYELMMPDAWRELPFFEQDFSTLPPDQALREQSTDPKRTFETIIRGSMPEPAKREFDTAFHNRFYSSYVQTYLERDVSGLDGVRNLNDFELFYRLLAGRTGQLLNYSNLAGEVGVSVNTIKEWTNILVRGFQIYLLKPYFHSFSKRLVKTPKVYFLDSGLQAYVTGWKDAETALRGPMAGHMFENWVVTNLLRSYWHRGKNAPLYFWRTRTGEEIDLWAKRADIIDTAEIKLSTKAKEEYFAPLKTIDPSPEQLGRRIVLSLNTELLQIKNSMWNIPVTYIN
jgi:hypothetical protein